MKDILMILGGLVAGLVIWFLKNLISNQLKNKAKAIISPEGEVNDIEKFNFKKLKEGITSVVRGDLWGKTINQELSLRTWMIRLAIIGVIIGVIFGYGYYKGKINKPVQLVIDEAVEFTILVPNSNLALYKAKHSTQLHWINVITGKTISIVKVEEIPQLKKLLRPYGLQLKPIGVFGGGLGESGANIEGGLGISFAKWFQWSADTFLTNKGIYLGASYKLDNFKLNNSSIGAGIGKGYKGDNRVLIYYKWEF